MEKNDIETRSSVAFFTQIKQEYRCYIKKIVQADK